jgi:hypothetical protein
VKSNEENKTTEINDLEVFTRYSVVITAFVGNVSGAYTDGKSSAEVIITTLESGKELISPCLTISCDLAVGFSYTSSHSSQERMCALNSDRTFKKINKCNDSAIDKIKVVYTFGAMCRIFSPYK